MTTRVGMLAATSRPTCPTRKAASIWPSSLLGSSAEGCITRHSLKPLLSKWFRRQGVSILGLLDRFAEKLVAEELSSRRRFREVLLWLAAGRRHPPVPA